MRPARYNTGTYGYSEARDTPRDGCPLSRLIYALCPGGTSRIFVPPHVKQEDSSAKIRDGIPDLFIFSAIHPRATRPRELSILNISVNKLHALEGA